MAECMSGVALRKSIPRYEPSLIGNLSTSALTACHSLGDCSRYSQNQPGCSGVFPWNPKSTMFAQALAEAESTFLSRITFIMLRQESEQVFNPPFSSHFVSVLWRKSRSWTPRRPKGMSLFRQLIGIRGRDEVEYNAPI